MHLSHPRLPPAVAAWILVFGVIPAANASAQVLTTCLDRAGHLAVGLGVNAIASDTHVSAALDDPDPDVSTEVFGGPGLSFDGLIPLAGTWNVRAFAGIARFGADGIRRDRRSYEEVSREDDGGADIRRLQLGLVRGSGIGRRLCMYGGFTAGVFRATYKGVTTRPVSVSGLLGFDMPLGIGNANSLAVELQVDVAPNHSRPPFNAYDIVAIGASVVFRHRF